MRIPGRWWLPAVLAAPAVALAACSGAPAAHPSRPPTTTAPAPVTHAIAAPPAPHTTAAKPTPTTPPPFDPCTDNTAAQLVYVSIARQHLWMCAGAKTVRDDGVTTGMVGEYTNTPTGTYEIQNKVTDTTLTLNTGATYDVKYWIPFDGPLFGFHDSSWQTFPYGSQQYRTDGSHGCIHMPLSDIAYLYRWADVGAKVVIVS